MKDLNPRHPPYQNGALTSELTAFAAFAVRTAHYLFYTRSTLSTATLDALAARPKFDTFLARNQMDRFAMTAPDL